MAKLRPTVLPEPALAPVDIGHKALIATALFTRRPAWVLAQIGCVRFLHHP